jgi:hypothetical protein
VAGLLECPAGTTYSQIITLAEAYIYKNREKAGEMWAAIAVMDALKESRCGKGVSRPKR